MRLSSSPLLFLLGTFSTRAGAKSDWKPIASSIEPSYIDYFGLDQSTGTESLTGKLSSSTAGYSRRERVPPRSPQTLKTWPGTQPRRRAYYDKNQLMGRSGNISYEEMKKMVEENLTVEKVLHTVMEMAMESGPARLAMIVAAISFAQTTFLNFTYFLSYNRANLIGAGDLIMLISIILNGVVLIIGLWPEGILATGKRR